MKKLFLIGVVLSLTSAAWAWPPKPLPIGDVAFERVGNSLNRDGDVVYSNLDPNSQTLPEVYYVPTAEAGAAYGDDLHMTAGGYLTAFSFAYYDPEGGDALSEALVAFYENDETDTDFPGGDPGSTLIGSCMISDLPGDGAYIVTVDAPESLSMPEHVWMEVAFLDSTEAGLVLYNPPTVGDSHDLFYVHGVCEFVFEYPYVANFGLAVTTQEIACPGDLNYDGERNLADLAAMLGHYGHTDATYEEGDINGDGEVNLADLAEMLRNYGHPCP